VLQRSFVRGLVAAGLSLAFGATSLTASEGIATQSSPDALALLNRITWGASATRAATLRALGTERWLQRQLYPTSEDQLPREAAAQVDALAVARKPLIEVVNELDAQNKTANQIADPEQKKLAQQAYQRALTDLARQAATRAILRALYSPAQLRERMVWFWYNHFNVHQHKANVRAMVGDYEERAIRPHALGRFRDLLGATLRHPAMLRYLDNAENAAGRVNENYAREIMELHTMGVGSGYTQKDVEELARILTGIGIDPRPENPKLKPELQHQLVRDGLFEFNPNRHDYGDKAFLGRPVAGRGLAEVEQVLDVLCRHPATARRIALKLATYFVEDGPSETLVQRMAEAFQKTDGDIPSVLAIMFQSPQFAASLGQKMKDPLEYVLSAVRLAYDDKIILNTAPIQGWLNRLAEGLYNHPTPDGYSLSASAWNGPGQMALRFEIARQIGSGSARLFKPEPGAADRPVFPLLQNALYFDGLRKSLSPSTLAALDQAISPQDWNTLFLASPEFMHH